MASCNLRNLSLEVWKLAQMYHFELGNLGNPKTAQANSLFDKRSLNGVGI